jgi:hypothetical protein
LPRRVTLTDTVSVGAHRFYRWKGSAGRPSAFFRTDADERIRGALGLSGPATLYGRRNTLSDPEGHPLADILEILPP